MNRGEEAARAAQRGSGTVLATALAFTVMVLLIGLALVAQALVAGQRVAVAADLAALGAADAARGLSIGEPCDIAGQIAASNGAEVRSCRILGPQGDIAEVHTVLRIAGFVGEATGRARAGPPESEP